MPDMQFCFGSADYGYGWLFPKRDHVNVGLYTCLSTASLSKQRLREFALTSLGTAEVEKISGYPLGFGGETYETTSQRVLFAGDAAGMAEMFLGEGLHNAIKSGEMAARAVTAAHTTGGDAGRTYDELIADIQRDLRASRFLALKCFYPRLQSLGLLMFRAPFVQGALMRGFAAGRTLPLIAQDLVKMQVHQPVFPNR